MAVFESFLSVVLAAEGGYANVTGDLGGETYRGISRRWHPNWQGWVNIDAIKRQRPIRHNEIIKDSNLDQLVSSFYRNNFWVPIRGSQILDQDVANVIADHAVGVGIDDAVKLAQWLLTEKFKIDTKIDGVIGPITLANLNRVNPRKFFNEYTDLRVDYYKYRGNDLTRDIKLDSVFKRLTGNNPSTSQGELFLKGWLFRMEKFIKKKVKL